MITLKEAMKRAMLLKGLDTDYKEAKLVYLSEANSENFTAWWILPEHLKVMKESLDPVNKFIYVEEVL